MTKERREIKWLSIDQLRFDPDNPRLPSTIDKKNDLSVFEWMLTDATLIELMTSIGTAGYFSAEPLIVHKENGFYEVIEGNRRLAAVRLLNDPELATSRKKAVLAVAEAAIEKPKELPVLIYNNRSEVLAFLGYRHVTGIKEWNPLAKAKYLKDLYKYYKDSAGSDIYNTLAKFIGSRADYAARILTALSVYEHIADKDFYDIHGLTEESIAFSVLTTALNYSSLKGFVGIKGYYSFENPAFNDSNLKDFTSWLFEKTEGTTRLGESRNLKQLSKIVDNERALMSFRRGAPLVEAALYTDDAEESFHNLIQVSKTKLSQANELIYLLKTKNEQDLELLREIKKMASAMIGSIDGLFNEKE